MATKQEVQTAAAERAQRVLGMRDQGLTVIAIAQVEKVSQQAIYKILKKAGR